MRLQLKRAYDQSLARTSFPAWYKHLRLKIINRWQDENSLRDAFFGPHSSQKFVPRGSSINGQIFERNSTCSGYDQNGSSFTMMDLPITFFIRCLSISGTKERKSDRPTYSPNLTTSSLFPNLKLVMGNSENVVDIQSRGTIFLKANFSKRIFMYAVYTQYTEN